MTLSELAERLQCRLEQGDGSPGNIDIVRVAGIEHAQDGDITFVDNPRYVAHLASTQASALILADGQEVPASARFAVLRSKQPYVDFARAVVFFVLTRRPPRGV